MEVSEERFINSIQAETLCLAKESLEVRRVGFG
jgi:hypothetical protein